MHRPLRLRIDTAALTGNWRWLADRSGTACGAAVKADGYGIGAHLAVDTLAAAGCRDFFVATWDEADRLGPLPEGGSLSILHGVGPDDISAALASTARPVLSSIEQVARWKQVAPGRTCDLMVDTGMNRLGLRPEQLAAADGLQIDTLMSHLACADQDHPLNDTQLARFQGIAAALPARRASLANSAGVCLGRDYSFDLVRPGLALYGGIPRAEATGHIAQVAFPQAQVVQRRIVPPGESIGYGATFVAVAETQVAILNLGYADGYWRGFSGTGSATHGGATLPIVGRVSMDLIAIECGAAPTLREGDWVDIAYDLATASAASGMSQYELLTGLGGRFDRG